MGEPIADDDGRRHPVVLVEEHQGETAGLAVGVGHEEVDGVGAQHRVVEREVAEVRGQVLEGHAADGAG
ncbi:hypothetical protein [Knoellia locipacati]|uniref:hypothetical protein n=1 Tax=Knoellia locipacati TaxID=882824 RepID=UPI0011BF356F|nr:hypothetical protein [Knoellia locipacati]